MRYLIILSMLFFSSCATVLEPGPDKVKITSNPSGAKVFLNGDPVGETPIVLSLGHDLREAKIRVAADGYDPIVVSKYKVFSSTVILDGLLWPVFFIDLAAKNIKHFPDDPIAVDLKKSAEQVAKP